MIILEGPFVSQLLLEYLKRTGIPVLKNKFAEGSATASDIDLNFVSDEEMISFFKERKRLYAISENALDWIYANIPDKEYISKINILKDKGEFRKLCRSIYPDFFFEEVQFDDLDKLDIQKVKMPFVLKPAIGFLSAGVHVVTSETDWKRVLENLHQDFDTLKDSFFSSVLQKSKFLVEEYIVGDEFAVDAYYNEVGEPVIVNIFKHPFSSTTDVADRLYYTNKELFVEYAAPFKEFLKNINKVLNIKNIPFHIEFRANGNVIIPIEVNPMRFAGMCLNDIFKYIDGRHPIDIYLNNLSVDYNEMWKGKENVTYSFMVLEKGSGMKDKKLDFEKVKKKFSNVLELRVVDHLNLNTFGFLLTRTEKENISELENFLKLDLKEYTI
ncbi:MAG: ATP-grasp domain-containing protein [Prevotellaceae bacterium]|jgi:hypothetical protein|nr:ATP-grasp domain-containing protein [Prevotellaceae bacterium]